MANKLFGAADSTLVRAAFMHGASNIPKDLSAVYKQREQNVEDFATGINEVFEKIYADDKATNDLLGEVASKSLQIMETGGPVNDTDFSMHHDVVNSYKQRLKDITGEYGMGKGGDLERSRLRNDMNTYLANAQKEEELYTNMVTLSSNNLLLGEAGDQRKELLAKIIEDQNNNTNNVKKEVIKGQKYYTLPGTDVKMTMQEISDGLHRKDMGLVGQFSKDFVDIHAEGRRKGGRLDADDLLRLQNKMQTRLTSWPQIINVAQEKFGNQKYTFEEVLTGRGKDINGNIDTSVLEIVYNELERLGGADLDNDGDIDDADKSLLAKARQEGKVYVDAQNGFTLVDAIKKDKKLYRDVMANYLTETAARDFYGQGASEFKPKSNNNNNNNNNMPFAASEANEGVLGKNHPIKKSTITNYWNQLSAGKIGGYELVDGKWTDGKQKFTGDDMMKAIADNLSKQVPEGQYYSRDADFWLSQLKNNPSFKSFFGGSVDDGGGGVSAEDLSPYFGPEADEENAVDKLSEMYPKLKISSPIGMREKIKVNGEMFYLRGKGTSTPEMEMERLQKYIIEVDALNPNN